MSSPAMHSSSTHSIHAAINETMLQAKVTTSNTRYLVSCLGCWSGFQSSHPGLQAHQSKTDTSLLIMGTGLASSPAPSNPQVNLQTGVLITECRSGFQSCTLANYILVAWEQGGVPALLPNLAISNCKQHINHKIYTTCSTITKLEELG